MTQYKNIQLTARKAFLVMAMLVLSALTSYAQESYLGQASPEEIKLLLEKLYPATRFYQVKPTPIKNIFQVDLGQYTVYTDASGRYFLFGNMMDMLSQKDLTEVQDQKKVDVTQISLELAIKTVKGHGRQNIIIFSDPDCPYCQKLEEQLQALDDITVYTLLYPITSLHPLARAKAISIWCADNPSQSWKQVMVDKTQIRELNCSNPLDKIALLAQHIGIEGTPTLIAEDGHKLVGLTSLAHLKVWLAEHSVIK